MTASGGRCYFNKRPDHDTCAGHDPEQLDKGVDMEALGAYAKRVGLPQFLAECGMHVNTDLPPKRAARSLEDF
jgi:hypothetical protein